MQFQSLSTTSPLPHSIVQLSNPTQGAPLPSVAASYKPTKSDKHLPSVHRDFFEQLPCVPAIPGRIEPASVIDHNEDMSEIRKKFAALAAEAIRKITSKGLRKRSIFMYEYDMMFSCRLHEERQEQRPHHGEGSTRI